jgi:nucleoid-associated protein YgaU
VPSRYDGCSIINNSKKIDSEGNTKRIRRLSSVMYSDYANNKDVQIVSQQGDRLDTLALEYFGDETLWYVIAKVNNLGKGSLTIPPGKIIRIPYYDEYTGIAALFDRYTENG